MEEFSESDIPSSLELADILSDFVANFDVENNSELCADDTWAKIIDRNVLEEYNLSNLEDNEAFQDFILKICRINSNLTVARLWRGLGLAVQIR